MYNINIQKGAFREIVESSVRRLFCMTIQYYTLVYVKVVSQIDAIDILSLVQSTEVTTEMTLVM
jgi:hypothetical protein